MRAEGRGRSTHLLVDAVARVEGNLPLLLESSEGGLEVNTG